MDDKTTGTEPSNATTTAPGEPKRRLKLRVYGAWLYLAPEPVTDADLAALKSFPPGGWTFIAQDGYGPEPDAEHLRRIFNGFADHIVGDRKPLGCWVVALGRGDTMTPFLWLDRGKALEREAARATIEKGA